MQSSGLYLVGWRGSKVRLDRAVGLHGQRIASAIERLADGDADPSLADAILLDIGAFDALEADADAPPQRGLVVERAMGLLDRRSGGMSDIMAPPGNRSRPIAVRPTCPTRAPLATLAAGAAGTMRWWARSPDGTPRRCRPRSVPSPSARSASSARRPWRTATRFRPAAPAGRHRR